ncbi:MAG: serine/threonine protein kinase [Anaerolineales bacterium]|nr:serine/threonine protein kinase [Anaerolineales bacterium]
MRPTTIVLNQRYKLLERIGSGGMSVVYKAQDVLLGRLVAVKMLHESFTGDPDFLRRFRQEAYAAANLTHPNIVTVHDIGQDGQRHYIVMEFVDGQTLKQMIRTYNQEDKVMPINQMLDLTIQICAGIGYAHRAQLVHCDVKPQNVLVTHDNRIKVADFGIARAMTEASTQIQDSRVWGTPQYFSPEQASGIQATPASDVYSIGVIMFEMLTGKLPFKAESQTALALKHIMDQPPPVSEFNPAVPYQLELITTKVLSKEPSGRYRTAGQLGRILSSYRENSLGETAVGTTATAAAAFTQVSGIPTSDQPTQIFIQPTGPTVEQKTIYAAGEAAAVTPQPAAQSEKDWMAIGLGLLAIIALLGLIPLWYFVYLAYSS